MTFSEAKRQFAIRHSLWAASELEREITESFPAFRAFKTGSYFSDYLFMQQLTRAEQLAYASGLVKKFNQATNVLSEPCSDLEIQLLDRRRQFALALNAKRLPFKKLPGVKYSNKSKLRRVILTKFKAAFGHECIGLECVGLDQELNFKMKICGWIVSTNFNFERHQRVDFHHHIYSASFNEYRGAQIPTMILGGMLCYHSWLFKASQTDWAQLLDEDIEPVCDFIIQYCRRFFEVLPKMLKGLEFENVTAE